MKITYDPTDEAQLLVRTADGAQRTAVEMMQLALNGYMAAVSTDPDVDVNLPEGMMKMVEYFRIIPACEYKGDESRTDFYPPDHPSVSADRSHDETRLRHLAASPFSSCLW